LRQKNFSIFLKWLKKISNLTRASDIEVAIGTLSWKILFRMVKKLTSFAVEAKNFSKVLAAGGA
jgi:hypothetical protein